MQSIEIFITLTNTRLVSSGPAPLLPKPPPMQTYALIPIGGGGVPTVVSPQPVLMSSWAMQSGTSSSSVVSLPSSSTITTDATSLVSTSTLTSSSSGKPKWSWQWNQALLFSRVNWKKCLTCITLFYHCHIHNRSTL